MIKTTATGGDIALIGTGQVAQYQGFQIEYNWSGFAKNIIGIDAYYHAYFPTSGTVINDGIWHSVVVTYDGTTLRIYVDGRLDNSATNWNVAPFTSLTATMNTQGNNIYLGKSIWNTYPLWKGSLMNVNFYDYVITVSPLVITE